MTNDNKEQKTTSLTIEGVTYKTGGNIVFADSDYYLAQGSQLVQVEGLLEHGMQMLLKKVQR